MTVFVFVTTSDGIQIEQKITKKDGGDYVRPLNIPQYALCPQFGFGELADKMREAEPSIFQDETYQVEESPEELSVLQSLPDDEE